MQWCFVTTGTSNDALCICGKQSTLIFFIELSAFLEYNIIPQICMIYVPRICTHASWVHVYALKTFLPMDHSNCSNFLIRINNSIMLKLRVSINFCWLSWAVPCSSCVFYLHDKHSKGASEEHCSNSSRSFLPPQMMQWNLSRAPT